MAHLLAIILAVVREHIDHQQLASRFEGSGGFRQNPGRIGEMMQHHHRHGRIQRVIIDGEVFESTLSKLDLVQPSQTSAGGGQHGG